ncbi:MAG TPA: dTMP kinase [Bacteroidota bacterium]|jgi:dTMP kinase|nr:dTMP kinase [Bacteroidota bacterium]
MFITFEGLDGSGKTTQATLLVDRLRITGKEPVFLREPGGTAISEKIRDILLDRQHLELGRKAEVFLFSAARTQLVEEVICPALRAGKIVVCDRFYDSTTAYQAYGRGLDLEEVKSINMIATSGTTPDLTVLVDVELEEIGRRRRAAKVSDDRMEAAGMKFFKRVREGYQVLAAEEPHRIALVNGMRPVNDIHDEIWNIVQQRINRSRSSS